MQLNECIRVKDMDMESSKSHISLFFSLCSMSARNRGFGSDQLEIIRSQGISFCYASGCYIPGSGSRDITP